MKERVTKQLMILMKMPMKGKRVENSTAEGEPRVKKRRMITIPKHWKEVKTGKLKKNFDDQSLQEVIESNLLLSKDLVTLYIPFNAN